MEGDGGAGHLPGSRRFPSQGEHRAPREVCLLHSESFLCQEKKVVVCDPDILSFNIKHHRMHFAILASDGLWDTHSNEDAVSVIGNR